MQEARYFWDMKWRATADEDGHRCFAAALPVKEVRHSATDSVEFVEVQFASFVGHVSLLFGADDPPLGGWDAATYITNLPKKESALPEWQTAIEALMLCSRSRDGHTMLARIAGVQPRTQRDALGQAEAEKGRMKGDRRLRRVTVLTPDEVPPFELPDRRSVPWSCQR
ncbi:MAG: hypothetical protein ABI192_10875 [Bradyrhizobium sp.]